MLALTLLAASNLTLGTLTQSPDCSSQPVRAHVDGDVAQLVVEIPREWVGRCEVTLPLEVPAHRSFAVRRVSTRAMANLGAGDYRAILYRASFDHAPQVGLATVEVQGPNDGLFDASTDIPDAALAWSPCGGTHTLNLTVNGSGLMPVPSTMHVMNNFALVWKDCGE